MTDRPRYDAPAPTDGREVHYVALLLTVAFAIVLAPLNATMLAVALPELRRDFGVGHGEIAWLVSAYLIAMAVAQPIGGRLGDQLGRVVVVRTGLLLFVAISIAAALAPDFWVLIALRTAQALIGAAIMPNALAMLREALPTSRLGRSNGLIGAVISLAAAVGPLIGAGLLAAGSWRLLFLVNIPIAAAALLALAFLRYPGLTSRKNLSLDWRGAALFAIILALVTLLLGAIDGGDRGLLLLALVALPVLLLGFVQLQMTAANPIAEWSLFRNRSYAAATVYTLLTNLILYTAILAIPFFAEEVQGRSTAESGLLLGALSIPVVVLSPIGGRLSDAMGRRLPVSVGSLCVTAGSTALLLGIAVDTPYAYLFAALALLGAGLGLSLGPSGAAAIESAPRELAGAAAGANAMMRYIGSIVGVGILGAALQTNATAPEIDVFRFIFGVLAAASLASFAASLFIHGFAAEQPESASGHARVSKAAARPASRV